jgi:hypothetical protein
VDVRDAEISANFGAGIQAIQAGGVDVRRTLITGNIADGAGFNGGHGIVGGFHSMLRVRGTSIVTGNAGNGVQVFNDSGADFRNEGGAPSVSGNTGSNLECFGSESSVSGDTSGVATISPGCTGF